MGSVPGAIAARLVDLRLRGLDGFHEIRFDA
jgi:hypothetical protein